MPCPRAAVLGALLALLAAPARSSPAEGPAGALPAEVRARLADAPLLQVVALDPRVHGAFGRTGTAGAEPATLAAWLPALAQGDGVRGRVRVRAAERGPLLADLERAFAATPAAGGPWAPTRALVALGGAAPAVLLLSPDAGRALLLHGASAASSTVPCAADEALLARLERLLRVGGVTEEVAGPGAGAAPAPVPPEALAARVPADVLPLLLDPDAVEVLRLDPDVYRYAGSAPADPAPGAVRVPGAALAEVEALLAAGKGVSGRAPLTRPGVRGPLLAAVGHGLLAPGEPAACYHPRHALVLRRGPARAVLCLCFECSYAAVLGGSSTDRVLQAWGDPGGLQRRLDALLEDAAPPSPAPAPEACDVRLVAAGDDRAAVVREVRALTGLGLRAARALVDAAPALVRTDAARAHAEQAAARLRQSGATVEVLPAGR